jgi:uncharacterized protein (TIGR03067 family)
LFVYKRAQPNEDPKKEPPKKAESDTDRLQGSWILVSEERDGKPQPASQQKKIYTFAGDKLRLTIEGGDLREPIANKLGFRLNPSKKPKEIDGREDGNPVVKGIYLLVGDTLKVCIALPGKDRPTEFVTRQGTNSTLMILQRAAKHTEAKTKAVGSTALDSKSQIALAEKQVDIKRAAVKVAEAQKLNAIAILGSIKAQLVEAQAAETLAEKRLNRLEELARLKSIEESLVEEGRLKLNTAKARRTTVEGKIAESESQVLLEQARVELARLEAEETSLRLKHLKSSLAPLP